MGIPNAPDRRIGRRKPMRLEITWRIPEPGRKRRFSNAHAAAPSVTAHIVDVSVSGAAIEAPYAPDIARGHRVRIAVGAYYGVVVIRRITRSADGTVARYGVEFAQMDEGLVSYFYDYLGQDRPPWLQHHWNSSE